MNGVLARLDTTGGRVAVAEAQSAHQENRVDHGAHEAHSLAEATPLTLAADARAKGNRPATVPQLREVRRF